MYTIIHQNRESLTKAAAAAFLQDACFAGKGDEVLFQGADTLMKLQGRLRGVEHSAVDEIIAAAGERLPQTRAPIRAGKLVQFKVAA